MPGDMVVLQAVFEAALDAAHSLVNHYIAHERGDWTRELLARPRADGQITGAEHALVRRDFLLGFAQGLAQQYRRQVAREAYGLILVTPEAVNAQYAAEHPSAGDAGKLRVRELSEIKAVGVARGRRWSPQMAPRQFAFGGEA